MKQKREREREREMSALVHWSAFLQTNAQSTSLLFPAIPDSFEKVMDIVQSCEHATLSFHNQVDEHQGMTPYNDAATLLTSAYFDAFLGHFNVKNELDPHWHDVATQMEAIDAQFLDLFYNDLYNLMFGTMAKQLGNDFKSLVPAFQLVVTDVQTIVKDLMDLKPGGKKFHRETRDAISIHNDIIPPRENANSKFICNMAGILNQTVGVLTLATSKEMLNDLDELIMMIQMIPKKNPSLQQLKEWLVKLKGLLQTYDVKLQAMIPEITNLVTLMTQQCSSSLGITSHESSTKSRGNPLEFLKELGAFLEKVVVEMLQLLEHPPQPLTEDTLKLFMDVIAIIEPSKTAVAKDMIAHVTSFDKNMHSFVDILNHTLTDCQEWGTDASSAIEDVQSLTAALRQLLKSLL